MTKPEKRFALRLTEKARSILDCVDKGNKTNFINEAIIAYYEGNSKESFGNALIEVLKNIEIKIEMLNQSLQNLHFSPIEEKKKSNDEISEENKKRLKKFIREDLEL